MRKAMQWYCLTALSRGGNIKYHIILEKQFYLLIYHLDTLLEP